MRRWAKRVSSQMINQKEDCHEKDNMPVGRYDTLNHTRYLREVHCRHKSILLLQSVDYDDHDRVLERIDYPDSAKTRIVPGSISEKLRDAICP